MTKETKFIVLILAGLALSIFVLLASLKLADKPKLESPREVFLALVFDAYTVNYYETSNPNAHAAHRKLTEKLEVVCSAGCESELIVMLDRLRSLGGVQ